VTKRWTQRPPGSTWGDWGGDDELGRINLLTADKVLQSVREVEAGISFCLSLPHLHELASWLRAHDRSRFLLTAPPLRMPGVVGSPVTPVATV
jgi:hypothetical protein